MDEQSEPMIQVDPAPVSHNRYTGSPLEPMFASTKYEISDPSWSMPTLFVASGVSAVDIEKVLLRFSGFVDLPGVEAILADLYLRFIRSASRAAAAAGSRISCPVGLISLIVQTIHTGVGIVGADRSRPLCEFESQESTSLGGASDGLMLIVS